MSGAGAAAPVRAVIGLGSNVGDKADTIRRAIDLLVADEAIRLAARSRLYRTPPWGVTDQDWFLNACIAVDTTLDPRGLLDRCLAVELALGRRRERKWGPRTIDLDVLLFGDMDVDEPGLAIPHPHLLERAFVLVPLIDVAPEARVEGRPVRDALAALDRHGIEAMDEAG